MPRTQQRTRSLREDLRERQRAVICKVARHAFAAKGFRGASVHEIAAGAGVSVGQIYYLIGNKEALYTEVLEREGAALLETLEETLERLSGQPAIRRLDALVSAALAFFDKHREFFRIYINETGAVISRMTGLGSQRRFRIKERIDAITYDLIRQARREGSLKPLPAEELLTGFQELVHGFIARWAVGGFRGSLKRKRNVIRTMLWEGAATPSGLRRLPR
jgi:AcrR family transcriptional regulator